MLHVMEERHRVVVAPEEQDLPAETLEPIERRFLAVRKIPRLMREQVAGLPAPRHEARRMPIDARAGIGAEEFDEHAVIAR